MISSLRPVRSMKESLRWSGLLSRSFPRANFPQRACFYSQLSPLEEYDRRVKEGKIMNDPYQRKILDSMESLYSQLASYKPTEAPKSSFLGSLFGSSPPETHQPHGIYLWGDVGCGKSMLMDLFYDCVPQQLTKRRIHFHAFMQSVHKRNHELPHEDAAPIIAAEIAKQSNVLCFDEFQVVDVADAMILRRLMSEMLNRHGLILFMTSNREPDKLYENGVQRESFIPCIELLKRKNNVIYMQSPTDYRKIERPSQGTYFFAPPGKSLSDPSVRKEAEAHAERWFNFYGAGQPPEKHVQLQIWGRNVDIPLSVHGRVARFTFDQLCREPRSAADYLEITNAFAAFVVTDIPEMSVRDRDVVRRFITFLDAAYESKSKLAVTAAKPFEHLFNDSVPGLLDEINAAADSEDENMLNLHFTGDEEKFAFARALSRLKQMSSKEWHESAPDTK